MDNIVSIDTHMYGVQGITGCYLVGKLNELAIIETGTHASGSITWKELMKIPYFKPEKVKFIISTHIHLDHAGGTSYLLDRCPNAMVYHHYKTYRHLIDPERLYNSTKRTDAQMAKAYGKPEPIPVNRVTEIHAGEDIIVDSCELEIIDAPGHHTSHYAIYERSNDVLFTGDSAGWLFNTKTTKAIIPTTPPPQFNLIDYKKTIQSHIKQNPKTLAFTHFGFLNNDVEDVLLKSIEITEKWENLIRQNRKENELVSNQTMMKKLIDAYHPEFYDVDKKLLDVAFGVPISGFFHYLDKLEQVSK